MTYINDKNLSVTLSFDNNSWVYAGHGREIVSLFHLTRDLAVAAPSSYKQTNPFVLLFLHRLISNTQQSRVRITVFLIVFSVMKPLLVTEQKIK